MAMLAEMQCTVCREGDNPLTDKEIAAYSKKVPEWQTVEEKGVKKISRIFQFKDYLSTLAFTQAVGMAAEEDGHHPAILTEWGRVTVTWWTHKISGLHENDFIMAAKTGRIYQEME